MKIGVMFGNPETTTGGRAPAFLLLGAHRHPPHRPRQRRRPRYWQSHSSQGRQKQSGPPLSRSRIRPDFHGRPDRYLLEGDLIDIGVAKGLVDKSGAWFSYNGGRLGQGRDNARTFLRENSTIASEIEHKLRVELGLEAAVGQNEVGEADE